jgi:hypothetical protein
MRTQWEQELEWRSNPEKYNFRNKKHAMQA